MTHPLMAEERWKNRSSDDLQAKFFLLEGIFYRVVTSRLTLGGTQFASRINTEVSPKILSSRPLGVAKSADRCRRAHLRFYDLALSSGVLGGIFILLVCVFSYFFAPKAAAVPNPAKDSHQLRGTSLSRIQSWFQSEVGAPITSTEKSPDEAKTLRGFWGKTSRPRDTDPGLVLCMSQREGYRDLRAAFCPVDTKILTAQGITARLWDATTGHLVRTFEASRAPISSVAFSPDGSKILVGSLDRTARLWEAASGRFLRVFEGHEGPVTSVAFSPDGTKILTGAADFGFVGRDHTARLWDVAAGKLLRIFQGHEAGIWSVAFSPDGTKVLTGSGEFFFGIKDNTARIWDLNSGKLLRVFTGHEWLVTSVAFSPDGTKVLTGSLDKTARLWDAASGKLLCVFKGHEGGIWSVAFSPDGTKILTGSDDNAARLWDAASGNLVRILEGHKDWVSSVAFSPDGKKILTGSRDTTARLWDAATGSVLRVFRHD